MCWVQQNYLHNYISIIPPPPTPQQPPPPPGTAVGREEGRQESVCRPSDYGSAAGLHCILRHVLIKIRFLWLTAWRWGKHLRSLLKLTAFLRASAASPAARRSLMSLRFFAMSFARLSLTPFSNLSNVGKFSAQATQVQVNLYCVRNLLWRCCLVVSINVSP